MIPSRMTGRDIPVALDAAEMPPRPKAMLSAATTKRLERSSKRSRTAEKRQLDSSEIFHPHQNSPNIFNWKCYLLTGPKIRESLCVIVPVARFIKWSTI